MSQFHVLICQQFVLGCDFVSNEISQLVKVAHYDDASIWMVTAHLVNIGQCGFSGVIPSKALVPDGLRGRGLTSLVHFSLVFLQWSM